MKMGTPSPGPRRLMKTPSWATLSPKGERGGFPFSYIVVSRRIMMSSPRMTDRKRFSAACLAPPLQGPHNYCRETEGGEKPRQRRRPLAHGASRGNGIIPLGRPQSRQGRNLVDVARQRIGRRTDIAPSGAQRPRLDAPPPTACAVGYKMPPATRALRQPRTLG
jgi:hypothetical protein